MEKANKQGEVDLLKLFLKVVTIIKRNFWLIVIFFLIGTGLGLAFYYSSKKVYENTMVITSNILTQSFCQKLIAGTNRYLREHNNKALANQLNLTEAQAKELFLLKITDLLEIPDLKEPTAFLITVNVGDQEILPDLQKGIVRYLENNDFVKIRVNQNEKYYKETIAKIEQEIKDIEELKRKISNGEFFERAKGNVMFDPTIVNSKIVELTKEKLTLQNALGLVKSVQVVEGFSRFEQPSGPKLSISLVAGSSVGLFFVAILIVFKSLRRVLEMAESSNDESK
jgi:hypothetical protein